MPPRVTGRADGGDWCRWQPCDVTTCFGHARLNGLGNDCRDDPMFRLTISRAIVLFGLVTAMGLGAVIFTSNYALSELKVGGPIYDKIKLGNDLIADILPPPEYVIEAYLEATLALHDPASLAARTERLTQLKKEYDERLLFWQQSSLEPTLKSKLTETSNRAVQKFWTAAQQNLLPALAKNDTEAAKKSYADVSTAYAEHRGIIDQIVK